MSSESALNFSVQSLHSDPRPRPSTKLSVKLEELIKSQLEQEDDGEAADGPPAKRSNQRNSIDEEKEEATESKGIRSLDFEEAQQPPVLSAFADGEPNGPKADEEDDREERKEEEEDAESVGSASSASQHPLAAFGLPPNLSIALCSMLAAGRSGGAEAAGPSNPAAFLQAAGGGLRLPSSPFGGPNGIVLPPLGPLPGVGPLKTPTSAPVSAFFLNASASSPPANAATYMQSFAAMSAAVNAAMAAKNNSDQNNSFDATTISVNSFPGAFRSESRSPSSRSTSPSQSGNSQLSCAVCGDVSSGKHYGILACNGCSGFFKRSVRRRLIYRCQAGTGTCVVDKAHRNQCQHCRLRKCLTRGMNKDAVQNERQPRNTATIQTPEAADLYPLGGLLPTSRDDRPPQLLASSAAVLEFANGEQPSGRMAAARSGALPIDSPLPLQSAANAEASARMLFMAVKWTKTLPSFAALCAPDQLTLLMNSWAELFVLSVYQWSAEMERCPLLDGMESAEVMRPLLQLFERFKAYALDQAELTCLKAIVLFRPETRGLKDASLVERMQDQAQIMLQQHISRGHSMTRFGRVLLLIPVLEAACPPPLIEHAFMRVALGEKTLQSVITDIFRT